jgi:hypothetical protein
MLFSCYTLVTTVVALKVLKYDATLLAIPVAIAVLLIPPLHSQLKTK